jgi:hypothetical protein
MNQFLAAIPSDVASAVSAASAAASAHPLLIHASVAILAVAGLVLSFAGSRLMKPAFVLVGGLTGMVLGHLVPPALHPGGHALAALAIGAVLGAIAGWLFFRVFVAQCLGAVLALAAVLGVAAYAHANPASFGAERSPVDQALDAAQASARQARESIDQRMKDLLDRAEKSFEAAEAASKPAESPVVPNTLAPQAAAERSGDLLKDLGSQLARDIGNFWEDNLPPAARLALAFAAIAGYLVGTIAGMLLPVKASAIITALVGPAVWMPAGVYLLHAFDLPQAQSLPTRPETWLLVWAVAATLGLIVQLALARRKSKRKQDEPRPG